MGGIAAPLLVASLIALLLAAGVEDVRHREIANGKNLLIALLAPAWWWAAGIDPWPGMAIQLALGLGTFALFLVPYAMGQMGGGDVKLIGALALWLPFGSLAAMLVAMSLVGAAITLLLALEHWRARRGGQPEIPYGVAIAIAGMLALGEPNLNQFW